VTDLGLVLGLRVRRRAAGGEAESSAGEDDERSEHDTSITKMLVSS
jgi:hypothetical protein